MSETAPDLEKLFHPSNRLAIMSELCRHARGVAFTKLRDVLELSDGNLNRHLSVLAEAKVITIKKKFIQNKPRTTVHLTAQGRRLFLRYLDKLEAVLKEAHEAASSLNLRTTADH